ncbi:hypothetical protein P0O24_02185 [Methanotrichaceae archaeon M04Ac]|jgi:uncharacterized repeat protein (TIGR01451 family)|uniref:DUF11 domain-containing protein n=1 Tax=Candidatus Methanocrinis alkalitolerans TaxID=3033395 RepID=A0ABT5XCK2_9EURY|nr:hypothetical protein [Candidatus Methanocrinis alkalitolerans]MCR3883124.1 hypothetical protein [Methanothrix sp.]MDF0592390.1 hypothetical protein [Candidatus Methanocrinis alkalitolerans]
MFIRLTISIIVLAVALCVTSSAVTVVSTFECKTTADNGTMSHYSYLKEPKVQKNGYTIGYKTGSINYFFDGNINFSNKMTYYDGQIEPGFEEGDDTNSSVRHIQMVNFSGKRGISEFYAQGFFPSNRALSAGKKIRFENLTSIEYKPVTRSTAIVDFSRDRTQYIGKNPKRPDSLASVKYETPNKTASEDPFLRNYGASRILAYADVGMGPSSRTGSDGDYDFKYQAAVENGVIEIRDSTGWTNETGARRIDWDQDAIMRGSFNITNNLYAEDLFFPGAGLNDDWLPCCFDGTRPPIQNRKYPGVLSPEKLLPQYSRDRTGANISINCTPDNCTGFECIFTYAKGEGSIFSVPKRKLPTPEVSRLYASKVILEVNDIEMKPGIRPTVNNSDTVTYEIRVEHNDRDMLVRDIAVTDILPRDMIYVNDSARLKYETTDGEKELKFPPKPGVDKGTLTWYFNETNDPNLMELRNGFSVFIDLKVIVGSVDAAFANEVKASGISGNKTFESGVVRVSTTR